MTQQTTLHLITYAPALVGKDGRTVDVIHGMEKALPGPRLKWRLSLGRLNYWSAAAAKALGFPDPARDAELLTRARRTSSGGWVVQLTDAPLDLDNPAHLDALKRAYEHFPEIGGRVDPR